ncbi:MAG: acyl-CoA synthetase [Acidimicrobiales bacterium]
MRHDLPDVEFNLADLFECVADAVPEREALVAGGRRSTYAALEARSNRLAHGLATRFGVGPGDHVAIYLHNAGEYVETMLAAYKLRAVPVNVNHRYVAEELAFVLADAGAVGVVTSPELAPTVAAAAPDVWRVVTGDDYEAVLASSSSDRDFGRRSADDHYVLYTGGTTGMPKGVVWRHEDIFFATLGGGNPGGEPITDPAEIGTTVLTNRAQRITPFLPPGDPGPERFVSLALGPMMHASGQWSAFGALLGGGTSVMYTAPTMDMVAVLDLIESESVCMLTLVGDASGVPLVDALEAHPGRWDTTSLRLLGSGGSILSAEVKRRLLAALPTVLGIVEAVGSSEAPVQGVAVAQAGPQTSMAFAVRSDTVVFDDALRRVTPGSGVVGRLATSGRIPLRYHNDPRKSAETFVEVDGARWSMPGDMATVEEDGTIRLLGRGSMCINTGGEKVYPEEVEAVVKTHPGVADVVVVGIADDAFGERVAVVVALRAGAAPVTLAELQTTCRARLAGYKIPRHLVVVDEVPRSPSGKADYPWARSVLANGVASA